MSDTAAPTIHLVGLGPGDRAQLTFAAYDHLRTADGVYVMARPNSWMIEFVSSVCGAGKVRAYMPKSAAYRGAWSDDPVFESIADEVAERVAEGHEIVFAMAVMSRSARTSPTA